MQPVMTPVKSYAAMQTRKATNSHSHPPMSEEDTFVSDRARRSAVRGFECTRAK
jgi:hypothetical protein